MNELALFAGIGGGILASVQAGRRIIAAVERDAYAAQVLAQRQNDGSLPPFPIWSDVCSFDGKPWRGIVDCISGGFPCQDISIAGNGDGLDGEKSSMWYEMERIIGEVRPERVELENSPMLTSRGLGRVLAGLSALGYDSRWGVIPASAAGAPHKRERIWILSNSRGKHVQGIERELADQERWKGQDSGPLGSFHLRPDWWAVEPGVGRVADGVAYRMDRLKAIGNGQVPQCVNLAWSILEGSNKGSLI